MLGAVFVENRVGVVDVDKDAASASVAWELLEQAGSARQRKMADITSGSVAAAGPAKFVVAPESAVDQRDVRGSGEFGPVRIPAAQRWRDQKALAGMLEAEADGGLFGS